MVPVIYSAIIIACLVSIPADCRSHEILLEAVMPTAAAIEAQARAVEWLGLHPELVQRSLTVRPGRSA